MLYVEALIGFAAFFSLGWLLLAWPERVQNYFIRYYSRHPMLARFNPFLGFMRTSYYRLQLRIMGVLMILASLIILFGIVGGSIGES